MKFHELFHVMSVFLCAKVLYIHQFCVLYMFINKKNYYVDILTASRVFKNLSLSLIKVEKEGEIHLCLEMYEKSKKNQPLVQNHLVDSYIVTVAACDLFISAFDP